MWPTCMWPARSDSAGRFAGSVFHGAFHFHGTRPGHAPRPAQNRLTAAGRLAYPRRVEPLDERAIRASFVNCSKGDASRIRMPAGFADGAVPWDDLDFLGWTDPGAPQRALLVVPGEPDPTGLVLRRPGAVRSSAMRSSMCRICLTDHAASGVSLFVAPLAGPAGRRGNTVGEYLCTDLACSLYLRGRRQPKMRLVRREETLSLEERIDRAMTNLAAFTGRVLAG
jgi:FBP C-terminal treble-clef zinc-finger